MTDNMTGAEFDLAVIVLTNFILAQMTYDEDGFIDEREFMDLCVKCEEHIDKEYSKYADMLTVTGAARKNHDLMFRLSYYNPSGSAGYEKRVIIAQKAPTLKLTRRELEAIIEAKIKSLPQANKDN